LRILLVFICLHLLNNMSFNTFNDYVIVPLNSLDGRTLDFLTRVFDSIVNYYERLVNYTEKIQSLTLSDIFSARFVKLYICGFLMYKIVPRLCSGLYDKITQVLDQGLIYIFTRVVKRGFTLLASGGVYTTFVKDGFNHPCIEYVDGSIKIVALMGKDTIVTSRLTETEEPVIDFTFPKQEIVKEVNMASLELPSKVVGPGTLVFKDKPESTIPLGMGVRVGDFIYTAGHVASVLANLDLFYVQIHAKSGLVTFPIASKQFVLLACSTHENEFTDYFADIAVMCPPPNFWTTCSVRAVKASVPPASGMANLYYYNQEKGLVLTTGKFSTVTSNLLGLHHQCNTDYGTSGAPLFCKDKVIGIHLGCNMTAKTNIAYSITAVMELLKIISEVDKNIGQPLTNMPPPSFVKSDFVYEGSFDDYDSQGSLGVSSEPRKSVPKVISGSLGVQTGTDHKFAFKVGAAIYAVKVGPNIIVYDPEVQKIFNPTPSQVQNYYEQSDTHFDFKMKNKVGDTTLYDYLYDAIKQGFDLDDTYNGVNKYFPQNFSRFEIRDMLQDVRQTMKSTSKLSFILSAYDFKTAFPSYDPMSVDNYYKFRNLDKIEVTEVIAHLTKPKPIPVETIKEASPPKPVETAKEVVPKPKPKVKPTLTAHLVKVLIFEKFAKSKIKTKDTLSTRTVSADIELEGNRYFVSIVLDASNLTTFLQKYDLGVSAWGSCVMSIKVDQKDFPVNQVYETVNKQTKLDPTLLKVLFAQFLHFESGITFSGRCLVSSFETFSIDFVHPLTEAQVRVMQVSICHFVTNIKTLSLFNKSSSALYFQRDIIKVMYTDLACFETSSDVAAHSYFHELRRPPPVTTVDLASDFGTVGNTLNCSTTTTTKIRVSTLTDIDFSRDILTTVLDPEVRSLVCTMWLHRTMLSDLDPFDLAHGLKKLSKKTLIKFNPRRLARAVSKVEFSHWMYHLEHPITLVEFINKALEVFDTYTSLRRPKDSTEEQPTKRKRS
jgi:hypothetical protein